MGVQSLDQVEAGRLVDGQDTVSRLPRSVDLLQTGSASSLLTQLLVALRCCLQAPVCRQAMQPNSLSHT